MPGFSGAVGKANDVADSVPFARQPTSEQYSFNGVRVKRSVVPKFPDDKVFKEDEELFVCTDGVFLNSIQLRAKYSVRSNFELIKTLYKEKGLAFANELRGTFSGCLYHKPTDTFCLFTDHLGTKPLFYFVDVNAKLFFFGSELKTVAGLMKESGIDPSLSETGAYCLLTFGFMLRDHTLIDAVKRLSPGSVLCCQEGTVATKQYYRLDNTLCHKETSASVISATLSDLFTKAVEAEYDKDKEYGYRHIGTLSGGLDSRMNLLAARECGYRDLYTLTVSQSNYLDETIAKKIAAHCGFNSVFYSLDNGDYLRDIARPVSANDGLVLYSGAAHLYRILALLEWQQFGMLHTGMLGDVVAGGTYLSGDKQIKAEAAAGGYSRTLFSRIESTATAVAQEFENSELYLFYNRGINGIFNGYWMTNQFTECTSPFLHIDFLEYAINIQPQSRWNYRIYHRWISEHLREAGAFPWEFSGRKIGANHLFWHRVRRLQEVGGNIMRGPRPGYSMNPFGYWFKVNGGLVEFLDRYFRSHVELLNRTPQLYKDATNLFETGTALEKTQVLTLLAAVQLLGLEGT